MQLEYINRLRAPPLRNRIIREREREKKKDKREKRKNNLLFSNFFLSLQITNMNMDANLSVNNNK